MSPAEFGVNFFVAMFALIDPIGNVAVFAAATSKASPAGRRWVALYISLFSLGFLAFFYFTGLSLLRFFGISLPAFRIAGGILLLLLGLDMTRGDMTAAFADPSEEHEAVDAREMIGVRAKVTKVEIATAPMATRPAKVPVHPIALASPA